MIKKIIYKDKIIKLNHRSYPKRYKLFTCDTETIVGEPYTIQLYDGNEVFFEYVNKDNILDVFLKYLYERGLSKQLNLVYFHNIVYDMSVILYKYHKEFLNKKKIKINHRGFKIIFVYSNTSFCILKRKNKRFLCLDSFAFMNTSLEKFAEIIKSDYKKLEKPEFLGIRKPKNKKEKKIFEEYAKQDVIVLYEISKWILSKHKEYNIYPSFSNANFSERIFRHYFIKPEMKITLPPDDWVEKCILSYHGGKNGFYLDNTKGVYLLKDGVEVDIVSAYPFAMTKIPNFSAGVYKEVDNIDYEYEGVYVVDGICLNDKYPVIFDHNFKPIKYGEKIENICITSYELKEALRNNEIEIKKVKGLIYIPKNIFYNPLEEFVRDFFDKKSNAKDYDEKLFYKIILNSLYGKFIQSIEVDEMDKKENEILDYEISDNKLKKKEKIYRAGSCFNPFIATLITGFVRAYLHSLEHKYNAYHSSTDSIIIKNQKLENIGSDLGQLEVKVKGDCYLFRNKLYIWIVDNKISKYALHGFLGTPEQLLMMLRDKKTHYKVKKMIKVREAERLKNKTLKKLAINEIDRELRNVNFDNVIEI